jgi:hypothetical protein
MLAALKAKLKGFRSFITAGAVAGIGMLQLAGDIDITPVLRLVVKDENEIGVILVIVAFLMVILRSITSTPPGASAAPVEQEGPRKKSVDEGE